MRTLFVELSRVLNHLLAITTHAIDIGGTTLFLWGFEEREKLMSFYEAISGGRMHSGYLRAGAAGAISHYIPSFLVEEVILLCTDVPIKLQEIHNIITNNRI
jgi:NADH:ubiquinone oxidoreductase subunit D